MLPRRPMCGLRRPFVPLSPLSRLSAYRNVRVKSTTTTGEDKSGHIEASANESILWFDNLFPLKLSGLLRAPWQSPDQDLTGLLKRFEESKLGTMDPINMVKRALPKDTSVKVTEILPRLKDGGAFVKFTHPKNISAKDVESSIVELLQKQRMRPFFSPFRTVQASLVKGVPWLEDLHRFPKNRLRVEFVPPRPGEEAVELSQEELYTLFRKYGKIAEITSQPFDSKVMPKYAYVDFTFVRDAIMARNSLHGFVLPESQGGGKNGTKFRMSYEQRARQHRIWDWISNHPRIVIPVLVALLTGVTVVVFDPIRGFFVKAHVSEKFRLGNSSLYRWLRKHTTDILALHRDKSDQAGLEAIWTHRQDLIDQIQKWLMETVETFVIVQGPRGSGKKELVTEQALKGRSNVLIIDCKPIAEAKGESSTIKKMATAVGYKPIFSWANSMSSMVDLAIQSTTGVKAGFSETLETQLQKILQTTAGALTELGLEGRSKKDSDFQLPADSYLEMHPEKRPVVVIDNFLHKNESNPVVYDKIAEWAAALVQSNVAHVIFLTNDASYSKSLSKSLPDRVFRQAPLGDLSPEVAKRYILKHIDDHKTESAAAAAAVASGSVDVAKDEKKLLTAIPDLNGLDESINVLGGRLTDLEFLARRLKAGQSPARAVDEIVQQSASEILKMFLLPGKMSPTSTNGGNSCSTEQAWCLVKQLATSDTLRYNEVAISPTFASSTTSSGGADSAIDALASSELIVVRPDPLGRPASIAVGKPVYRAAFQRLASDPALRARMDLAVCKERVKIDGAEIEKAELELERLGSLPKMPSQVGPRVTYLLGKVEAAQRRVEEMEKEMSALKKVLAKEY